jgi:hypothetical protein
MQLQKRHKNCGKYRYHIKSRCDRINRWTIQFELGIESAGDYETIGFISDSNLNSVNSTQTRNLSREFTKKWNPNQDSSFIYIHYSIFKNGNQRSFDQFAISEVIRK